MPVVTPPILIQFARYHAAIALAALAATGCGDSYLTPTLRVIDEAGLAEHIQVLASDEFEGRSPSTPGETRTVRAGREIELSTNNAAAVVLTLNGKTLAPLGNPGETKQVTLTAKDLL